MISKLLRWLQVEKMIWRWGKSGVISNVEFGMLLILPCVVLASFLSTTVAWHHSPPVACAPSSVPSPLLVPSAPSSVPSPLLVPSAPSSVPSPPLVPSAPSSVPSPLLVPSASSSVPSPLLVPSAPSSLPLPPVPSAPSSLRLPPVPSAPSSVPSPSLVPSAPSSLPLPPVPSAPSSLPLPPPVPSAPSSVPSPPLVPSAPSSLPSPPPVPSAPSSLPSPPVPSAPSSVPSPSVLSAPSSVPSPPAPSAPRSVPSPPFCSPSAPSPVPSPPFCSRSVATTIGSALFALISLMKDAWGEASAQVSFTRRDFARFRWKVLLTIVMGLNPIVGTFYVLQTMFTSWKYFLLIKQQCWAVCVHSRYIAKAMADTWVAVGVANAKSIDPGYRLRKQGQEVVPDPDLVLNLAGTFNAHGNRKWPIPTATPPPAPAVLPPRRRPRPPPVNFFVLNYDGMLALLLSGVLNDAYYKQLRFLGGRTGLESAIIIFQSMSYIIAVVYRRIQHLKVSPIEGIGFACSLLFLVYVSVQCAFGSRSKEGLLIYLTPAQERRIRTFKIPNEQLQWFDPDRWAFILTFLVGLLVAVAATLLVYPVWAKKNMVDMLGHIIFFGDFLFQFIFFILYFKECFGTGNRYPELLLTPLLIIGIIALAGVALAIYATIRHWHDENFDIPTPSLGRYFPLIR